MMTLNLRYDNANDKENGWDLRKAELVTMIHFYHPAILGIQEGLSNQVAYLDSALTDYHYTGVGREDGKRKGEFSAIFYNKHTIKLISSKTYWLSETPDTVSIGWDAALERIVTFGEFVQVKQNDTFYVFNCHMDHIGKLARENSSKLILRIIDSMNIWHKKVVVMGDLNSQPDEVAAQTLSNRLLDMRGKPHVVSYGPEGTFNQFNTDLPVTNRIDYIFVKNITVTEHIHLDDRRKNNLWLSDHLPVLVKMRF
jgi:endonuclease/exonuclease/phosphatase family metal-dependent hydrolase